METSLAIYEALIQANVPTPAARRVAECLEKDMTSNLATKADFLLLRKDIEHLSQSMVTQFAALDSRFEAIDTRFEALESRMFLTMQNMETRLMMKLGTLMVVLIGVAGSLQKLLG